MQSQQYILINSQEQHFVSCETILSEDEVAILHSPSPHNITRGGKGIFHEEGNGTLSQCSHLNLPHGIALNQTIAKETQLQPPIEIVSLPHQSGAIGITAFYL